MTSVSTFRNPGEKNIAVIGIKLTKVPYICKRKPHSYHLYGFRLFYCCHGGKRGLSLFRPTLTTFIQQYIFKLIVQVAGRFFLVCHCCRFPSTLEEKHKFFSHTTIYFLIYSSKYF